MTLPSQSLPTTELPNAATEGLDKLPTLDMLRLINEQDATVSAAVATQLPQIAQAVDAIANALRAGGRLIYVGAGTSGRIGCLDAAECQPTFGVPAEMVFGIIAGGPRALLEAIEGAEDDADAGRQSIVDAEVSASDVVCGISASGGAPFVRGALLEANARDATTIAIANSAAPPIGPVAKIAIVAITGPEAVAGSTRLKAGTAQKLICNMLTTGAMVRIGKTYGNRMVDVQATNAKLVLRAQRLVTEIGSVPPERASVLLQQANDSVKIAIVMARRAVGAQDAQQMLDDAHGILSRILDDESDAAHATETGNG